jgi:hypothetical protein
VFRFSSKRNNRMERRGFLSLIGIMIFAVLFAVYDALRKINHHILEQTDEIKKLREELIKTKNTKLMNDV